MKLDFLKQSPRNERLILIVAGWNVSPSFFPLFERGGWDMAVAWDFSDLSSFPEIPSRYTTIYLYAWSFGVAVAEALAPASRLTEAFALNGTPEAISDEFGIPEPIFQATLDNLSHPSLRKFRNRMLSGLDPQAKAEALSRLEEPDVEDLRGQLINVRELPKAKRLNWRRAYVSMGDLVIPPAAQRHSWETHPAAPSIVELPGGHTPAFLDIIEGTVGNPEAVGECFSNAAGSYGRQALAQRRFAKVLADCIASRAVDPADRPASLPTPSDFLEIGPGDGTFTRMLAELLPRETEATFVDLFDVPRLGLFDSETYVAGDAESFMASTDRKWNLIASSSALQWFANPAAFFANAARCLTDSGLLAVGLLTKGTLEELEALRPSPLHYHTPEEIAAFASRHFPNVSFREEVEELRFPSAREALLHLRDTGVTAGPRLPLSAVLARLRERRLTYRATILLATRK